MVNTDKAYDRTASRSITIHIPIHLHLLVKRLCIGIHTIPFMEHGRCQFYPFIGCFKFIHIDKTHNTIEHTLRTSREILGEQSIALLLIGFINRIKLSPSRVWMHVPTIITPTGGLIVEGKGNCVVEAVEHCHSTRFAQQTIFCQHHLGTFQIATGKLFILEQVLEDASGVLAAIVLAEHILVGVVKNELGIPTEETEAFAIGSLTTNGIPVMVIPVCIATILVDQHIIDEGINIEQRLQFRIWISMGIKSLQLVIIGVISSLLSGLRHQLVGFHIALSSFKMVATVFLHLDGINVLFLTTQMIYTIFLIHTLSNVIESPIHAIEEHMHIESIHACPAHLALHTTCPHITSVLCFPTIRLHPMLPRIAEMTAQHKLVELMGLILSKERVFEVLLAIFLLEDEAERVLGVFLCQTPMTTMQTKSTGDMHIMRHLIAVLIEIGAPKEFHIGETSPTMPRIITHWRTRKDVDATRIRVWFWIEKVIFVGQDAQHGQ